MASNFLKRKAEEEAKKIDKEYGSGTYGSTAYLEQKTKKTSEKSSSTNSRGAESEKSNGKASSFLRQKAAEHSLVNAEQPYNSTSASPSVSSYGMTKAEYDMRRSSNPSMPEYGSYEYYKSREESLRPIMEEISNDFDRKDPTYKAWVENYESGLMPDDVNEYTREKVINLSKKFKYQNSIIAEYKDINEQLQKFDKKGIHYNDLGEIDTKSGAEEAKYARERYSNILSADAMTTLEMAQGYAGQLPIDKQKEYYDKENMANIGLIEGQKEDAYNYYEKNKDNAYKDNFGGRFAGNYKLGRIGIKSNQAGYTSFYATSDDIEASEVYQALGERIQNRNKATFKNNGATDKIISIIGQYAPQGVDQAIVGTIGRVVGGLAGNQSAGRATATALYMYEQTAGAKYVQLLQESNLSVEDAKKLASSEALASSIIEFGLDYATSKLWSKVGSTSVANNATSAFGDKLTKALTAIGISEKGVKTILDVAKNTGKLVLHSMGEGSEEWWQEGVSITADRYAKEGETASPFRLLLQSLWVPQYSKDDLNRMNESFMGGAVVGFGMGGVDAVSSYGMNKVMSVLDNRLQATEQTTAEVTPPHDFNTRSRNTFTEQPDTLEQAAMDVVNERNTTSVIELLEKRKKGKVDAELLDTLTQANEEITAEEVKKATIFGDNGAKLVAELANKDGATFSQAEKAVKAAYMAGFTNVESKQVSFTTETQINAYTAGKQDRAMQDIADKERAKNAVVNKHSGFNAQNLPSDVTQAQTEIVDLLSKSMGVKSFVTKGLKGNAEIRHDTGEVAIDFDFERKHNGQDVSIVFHAAHEIALHSVVTRAPEEGRAFVYAMYNHLAGNESLLDSTLADEKRAAYGEQGVELSLAQAMEEISANNILYLYGNDEGKFQKAIESIVNGNDTKAKQGLSKYIDYLKEMVRKIRDFLVGKTGKAKAEGQAELNEIIKLRDMFETAYAKAVENTRTIQNQPQTKSETKGKQNEISYSIREEYANEINSWVKEGKPDGESFILGTTGDVLQGLGAIESDIYMLGDKIKEILDAHHEMTIDEIKKIPQILENPILILKSRNVGREDAGNSRLVIFGNVKAKDGRPILSVLDLRPVEKNLVVADMQKVSSAYTKDVEPEAFVRRSLVVYADKKRTTKLLRSIGFKIPIELQKSGYIGSISYIERSVKINGEEFSNVFKETTKFVKTDFSLKDSEGKTLTEEQAEFFKDTMVRDENGNLLVVYHGSPSKFTVFSHKYLNVNGNSHGRGFYFTEKRSLAEGYERENGQLLKGYLNITNPLSEDKVTIKKADFLKLVKATCKEEAQEYVNDGDYDSVSEALRDTWISNYVNTYETSMDNAYREVANIIYSSNENDVELIAELTNAGRNDIVLRLTHDILGYDGVIYTADDGSHEFVSLVSEQFKSATNAKPTNDPDIRFSLKDSDYLKAVDNGDTETAQRMVDEAAVKAGVDTDSDGKPIPLHHGTSNFGFTTIDTQYSDDKLTFWATTELKVASSYNGHNISTGISNEVREIGKKENIQQKPKLNHLTDSAEKIVETAKDVVPALKNKNIQIRSERELLKEAKKDIISAKKLANKLMKTDSLPKEESNLVADFISAVDNTDYRAILKASEQCRHMQTDSNSTLDEFISKAYDIYDTLDSPIVIDGEPYFTEWITDRYNTAVGERGVYKMYYKANNPYVIDCKGVNWNQIEAPAEVSPNGEKMNTRQIARWAFDHGYDSVKYVNAVDMGNKYAEKVPATVWAFMKPQQQLWSADAVTYDDDGNVIPLSERFSEQSDDIRYSLKDSEGKTLTESQQEYFKDSKIRDKDGNLLVMYHGTTRGGFTVFDGGKDYWYFTNDKKYSYTFEGRKQNGQFYPYTKERMEKGQATPQRYKVYLNVTNPYIADVDTVEDALYWDRSLAGLLREKGYDALMTEDMSQVIVLNANQIKNTDNKKPTKDNDIRFSLKGISETSTKDRKQLIEIIEHLKSEFEITKFAKADQKKLAKMTRDILKDYTSQADFDSTFSDIDELYGYMANGEDGHSAVWEEVYSRAYKIAQNIVENAVVVDDYMYQEYKHLRDYLRTTPMKFNAEQDSVPSYYENFNDLRKHNMGRLKFTNDGMSIDSVYQELAALYPQFFDAEEQTNSADQLEHIIDVLDEMRPTEVNPFDSEFRQATMHLANDLTSRFFDIPQAKPTFADKAERRVIEARIAGAKKVEAVRQQKNEKIKKLIEAQREKTKKQLDKVRQQRDDKVKKEREKRRESIAKMSESQKAKVLRARIMRHTSDLSKKLLNPTDNQHIPQELQGAVAKLLECINLESNYTYDTESHSYKKNDEGLPSRRTKAFNDLKTLYSEMASSVVVDPDLLGDNGWLSDVISLADKRIVDMTSSELDTVWQAIRAIEASVNTANKLFSEGKFATILEIAEALRASNEGKVSKTEFKGVIGKGKKLAALDMLTPETYLHYLGNAGDSVFRMMRDAQDKHISIMKEVADFTHKALDGADVNSLENTIHTVKLGGEDVQLSTAQIMELYVLMNRDQAKEHILIGGILPDAINTKGLKQITRTKPIRSISVAEISKAISKLTDEQKKVADKLQKYVSTVLSAYGNEASMQVYNYEKFTEKNYWTIRTNRQEIKSDVDKDTAVTTVANKGMTKATKPHANTSVRIGSIFDTFASHSSDMATYAAWLGTSEDVNRIRNFVFWENGARTGTVKDILDTVHGTQGSEYLKNLLTDIAIGVKGEDNLNPLDRIVGHYKAASVGANLRVIIQQPTAIIRALDMIDAKYLAEGTLRPLKGWEKAKKYAPIAQWKDWGHFDINTGRQMKDVLFDNASLLEKTKQVGMWGASMADSLAWGQLWNAVELETRATHKDLAVGSEEYYQTVAKRFTEIVDHTQVVDGILQRSQVMRSADSLTKMATSFMGEPTKQYNMAMSAYYDYATAEKGDARKKAAASLGRTALSLATAGIINACAQSIIDAMRDDDKEKDYWEKWLANFGANALDVVNVFNYIPYIKDIISIISGYSVTRMDTAALEKVRNAVVNMVKAATGTGKYTIAEASAALFAETAKLYGLPVANVKRDVKSLVMSVAIKTDSYLMQYRIEKAMLDINYAGNSKNFMDILFNAYNNDRAAYEFIYDDLLKNGYDAEKLQSGMETRMLKAQGVKKVSDLSKRYMTPADEKKYDSSLNKVKSSGVWKSANAEQKKNAETDLYNFLTSDSGDMEKTRAEAKAYGVDETEYTLWQLAIEMADQPKGQKGSGSYDYKEKAEAMNSLNLGDREIAYFFGKGLNGTAKEELEETLRAGIDMEEYVNFKAATSEMKADKNSKGNSIPNSKKRKVVNYLNNADLTDEEWEYFYYEIMNYKN